ncbi:sulfite reductase, ferredoxin dependent [Vacuolonema iberomarrocanum]|uniref:sulfite reductase, ferredoxin dependent n=1 Tax=Vacuolonema iberomarrocanum TaxID=3454632 RepID=UPI001A0172CB|nr:sulfite reductase, ferredoxin dependent [filamentous cyanobacterium LEGE 07170]
MSPTAAPNSPTQSPKVSKLEGIKDRSNQLREPLASELLLDTNHFTEEAIQILKFHGSYQQDNRDNRVKGQEKDYQMMLRTRSPGGIIPPELYRALDKISDDYGNGTLRATTRQGFQLHGILKKDLKTVMSTIVRNMGSTLGACGDLNRNVMAPPAPYANRPEYQYAWEYANNIADLLTPQTGAYYEIWLDGEKVISGEENPEVVAARQQQNDRTLFSDGEEPIYGKHYMPRKFKCSVTVPGDNSVDLFSQDLSLVVVVDDQNQLLGFNVYAGGGLGRTHNKEETFARAADPIGFVEQQDVYQAVKAIVAVQRDYGDRHNRRQARLKYLINDWGVEKFRTAVEAYFGKAFHPLKPLPEFKYEDFLGWHEQGDGKLFLGISVENGRVKDDGDFRLKSALQLINERYSLPIRVTPHQNILLYDIDPTNKADLQTILQNHGVQPVEALDTLVRYSMACPALPTCGLAITESERAIPGILERIRTLLTKVGLKDEHFVIRMTGCPNGCARPYLAELGFVGQSPESYQIWLGADPHQTRLAEIYADRVHINDLENMLEPLLIFFKRDRQSSESFGDFCHRVGMEKLRQFSAEYRAGLVSKSNRARHRIGVHDALYARLKTASSEQGLSMSEIVAKALEAYLA